MSPEGKRSAKSSSHISGKPKAVMWNRRYAMGGKNIEMSTSTFYYDPSRISAFS